MENVLNHETSQGAMECFQQALEEIKVDDTPWMAAVWRIKDGNIELNRVTTYKFPTGDFLAAVGYLSLHLFELAKRSINVSKGPLPRAKLFDDEDFGGMTGDNTDGSN